MSKWQQQLYQEISSAVSGVPFWKEYLADCPEGSSRGRTVHLAVFVEPYLKYVLEGRKTVESRFSRNLCAPYRRVHEGDVVILKRAAGAVVGICLVSSAWFYKLDPDSWKEIKGEYGASLCADGSKFWQAREKAAYATLMRFSHVARLRPMQCNKRDRRGWVVLCEGP
jgi:hypothetical protein